ncbi:MAG: glutamine synthetase III [Candidatus Cloacimonetes bacterium]|nr:glutamine synthetase III [Candidatus Cloacimonadota bacterium]MCF7869349.1 glutamine synthetase III [Candidatus Cloacimonadota bacterium]MCF7884744.1 glutamine synthetase III [Candidatus Cloacimonadota bacterium]
MSKIMSTFGELTFNQKAMREKLSQSVYDKMIATIEHGEPLDQSIASEVAHAMKEWAMQSGATHFTHWFQPQRGGTAEKHDAFICYDENLQLIERFNAANLIQSEPDASSFPSGGMRSTFEARGYTAWDPSSYAFLREGEKTKTLVIPSVFLSWTGHVLDLKTPLLRSLKALNKEAVHLQKILGNRFAKRMRVFMGPEQEYFLFPESILEKRPDLQICNRTLFGAPPARGQQMSDHYFGAISDKVFAFMEDLDLQLYRRGIPSKTRHNEVAPNQFELAPLYEEANVASDHNLQTMDLIRRVAKRHGLVAILHEKPIAGINGSGKHLNWSIADNTGANYLEPSRSPLKNISFLMTIGALLLGLDKYGPLLRAAVADAGNDHRLGAHEAPPAIMSVYLGTHLTQILDSIEGIGSVTDEKLASISLNVQKLPLISKDISDRNRTSPIAFTGNKIELRAVGSNQNCAEAATIFNLMMAHGYNEISRQLRGKKSNIKEQAIEVLKGILKKTKRVRFEGNSYSQNWLDEAAKLGLKAAKNTPAAISFYEEKASIELHKKFDILTRDELVSKTDIKREEYVNRCKIEFKTGVKISETLILPAISKTLHELTSSFLQLKELGLQNQELGQDIKYLNNIYSEVRCASEEMRNFLKKYHAEEDMHVYASACAEGGLELLEKLRYSVDKAEKRVAEDQWPLTKYQDLLSFV